MSDESKDFASPVLGLSDDVVRGIYAHGLEEMSPVQVRALPPLLSGRDAIVQAQSGTGKTAAFGIAALERVARNGQGTGDPQCLVICHTRELAAQTADVLKALGQYTRARVGLFIGGTPMRASVDTLAAGCEIVVGTPGRVDGLRASGALALSRVAVFVIDEVDEVLRDSACNSFLPIIKSLISACPGNAQLVLVSATVSPELLAMMDGVLRDPVKLLMEQRALPLAGIRQLRLPITREDERYGALRHAQVSSSAMQSMVFCGRRDTVDAVVARLRDDGCDAAALHSGLSAAERGQVMQLFRAGQTRVLVCTDVLARGVDVQQVGLVVMYDLCAAADTYLHCVGRCGRYGRQGCAVLIVNDHEDGPLRSFQALYDFTLEPHPE